MTTQELGQSPCFQRPAELGGCQEGVKALDALTDIIVLRRSIPGGGLRRETTLALIWVDFNPQRKGKKISVGSSGVRQGCGCMSTPQLCKAPAWSCEGKG